MTSRVNNHPFYFLGAIVFGAHMVYSLLNYLITLREKITMETAISY